MRRNSGQRGFTLFEVMAAVLVLGMLYTVLANAAMQGLHAEGETRRRLEASLIADRALAEIETQLALGTVPPSGAAEDAEDPFLVSVSVQAFDASALLPPPEPGEQAPPPPTGESLLTPPGAGGEGRLRRIDVVVSWAEAGEERSVSRTTFAFDTSGLEELFPDEEQQGAGPGAEEVTAEDLRGLSPQQALQRLQEMVQGRKGQKAQQGGQ